MYNFMCEYTGVSSDMMVNGRVLRKGLKAMLENVPREDFLNILRAQENGWLKIHGNVTFGYANANKAIELYEKFANGTEKEIILAQLLRLAEENKNTFNKNNDLEKFAIKFKAKKVRVEEPKVEEPKVEEPEADIEVESSTKSRKTKKVKKATED